jgi:hypothetical protein
MSRNRRRAVLSAAGTAVLLLATSGCTGGGGFAGTAAPDAEPLVRQTVQAFYAAFNAHGFDRVSAFTLPNGVTHDNEEQMRTFVVVERDGTWRIMQDQNTIVQPQP